MRRVVILEAAELAGERCRALWRRVVLSRDALGRPAHVLGCMMRGVPKQRKQHRWALVRVLRGELVLLSRKRRRNTLVVGCIAAVMCYGVLAMVYSGQPSTAEALLAAGGLMGIVAACLSRVVDAPAPLRRIAVLSHGVCASCMGGLSRSACSGLAICDSCNAAWDGREVHDEDGAISTMCESCGFDAAKPEIICPQCGHARRAAMGVRLRGGEAA